MDDMGSEESFGREPVNGIPMTQEEGLLRRLGEVERCVRGCVGVLSARGYSAVGLYR